MRIFLASLVLTLAVYCSTPHAAPIPPPRPPPPPVKTITGPPTVKELCRVNTLIWSGETWPITFTSDGNYICFGAMEEDGSRTAWYGQYTLEGWVIQIDEYTGEVRPDSAPKVYAGPWQRVLSLRRDKGVLAGEGWGGPLTLRRR